MQKFKVFKFIVTRFLFSFVFSTVIFVSDKLTWRGRRRRLHIRSIEVVYTQFRGTTRFPRMKGEAKIKRTSRNGTEIELSVSKMPRPFELGAGYATYVLWAVSPDGQIDNLGEIKRRGTFEFDSKISVTTPLQTFALIITAEPHFLVRRPSQAIMLENLSPYTQIRRERLRRARGSVFRQFVGFFPRCPNAGNRRTRLFKNAFDDFAGETSRRLARFAGAQRDATEEFKQAETLLRSRGKRWKAERPEEKLTLRRDNQSARRSKPKRLPPSAKKRAKNATKEPGRMPKRVRSKPNFADAQTQMDELRANSPEKRATANLPNATRLIFLIK
jgi:hypothetical protein